MRQDAQVASMAKTVTAPVGMPIWQVLPEQIGRAAVLALHDELALTPKPGLVTPTDRGSHHDMDAHTFMRSLFALRRYFVRMAQLGGQGAQFAQLEQCGIEAEARMLLATGGVNTHRGAIFTLGLITAAAGSVLSAARAPGQSAAHSGQSTPSWSGLGSLAPAIRLALVQNWGQALQARTARVSVLPGGQAAQRYGLRGASQEAADGFPLVFELAWPTLQAGLTRGLSHSEAMLDTLFAVMANLDDSNLAHRGGLDGLRFAQHTARQFLADGGVTQAQGLQRVHDIAKQFVQKNLSPGGAADTLAAACLLHRLQDLAIGAVR